MEGLVIDASRHEVLVDGTPVAYTAVEFRLLHHLALNRGRVFSREELARRVIGDESLAQGRAIDVHIHEVRKKLGPHRNLIETIRKVGYRFRDV
jgi:two-component system phosphate regulon response regulator PhoB